MLPLRFRTVSFINSSLMQKLKKYLFHTRCFESSGLSPNFASNIKTNLRQYTNKKDVKLNELTFK